MSTHAAHLRDARAEIERLRGALEEIAGYTIVRGEGLRPASMSYVTPERFATIAHDIACLALTLCPDCRSPERRSHPPEPGEPA